MYERGYTKGYTPPETLVEEKPRRLLPRILFWFFVITFLTGVVIALRHPSLQITQIDVEGVEVLDPEFVQVEVSSYLSGNALWFFPRSSVFLVSSKKIEKKVKALSSRIKTVNVQKKYFQKMSISIVEYLPSYVWCRYDEPTECYFMTADGVVYSKAPQFSGAVYTRIIAGPEGELPFTALSLEDLARIEVYKKELPKKNIFPEVFLYRDGRMLTMIASTQTNPKTEFFIRADTQPETILDALAATLRTPEFNSQYSAGKKILYIDMRSTNKVVYRFE